MREMEALEDERVSSLRSPGAWCGKALDFCCAGFLLTRGGRACFLLCFEVGTGGGGDRGDGGGRTRRGGGGGGGGGGVARAGGAAQAGRGGRGGGGGAGTRLTRAQGVPSRERGACVAQTEGEDVLSTNPLMIDPPWHSQSIWSLGELRGRPLRVSWTALVAALRASRQKPDVSLRSETSPCGREPQTAEEARQEQMKAARRLVAQAAASASAFNDTQVDASAQQEVRSTT
jgi:hypothetical protein